MSHEFCMRMICSLLYRGCPGGMGAEQFDRRIIDSSCSIAAQTVPEKIALPKTATELYIHDLKGTQYCVDINPLHIYLNVARKNRTVK